MDYNAKEMERDDELRMELQESRKKKNTCLDSMNPRELEEYMTS